MVGIDLMVNETDEIWSCFHGTGFPGLTKNREEFVLENFSSRTIMSNVTTIWIQLSHYVLLPTNLMKDIVHCVKLYL